MSDDKVYIVSRRVLPGPTGKDKSQRILEAIKRSRKQKHKWPVPEDAFLILDLHFSVKSFDRRSFHAEATLEIPVENGNEYFSVARSCKTAHGALRLVIADIQRSFWYHYMKKQKVYFKITGAGMEELYRGYL